MTRKRLAQLRQTFGDLRRAADKAGATEAFEACYQAALKGERDHRRFGALFTHGAARYYHSSADAARLFTIKWVTEGCAPPKNWLAVTTWREDARWGFAVHDAIAALEPGFAWPAFTWDYADDIAAGCADAT